MPWTCRELTWLLLCADLLFELCTDTLSKLQLRLDQIIIKMSVIAAHELTKLVGKASEAAAKAVDDGEAASESRCTDILKVLAGSQVTAAVLKETDAGKRINRLSKSTNEQIAAAATQVVQAWKACVKTQAADSGLQSTGSLPGVSSARSQSLPAADNGVEQQKASTSRPSTQQQRQQQPKAAAAGGSSKPPPKTGDPKRDKVLKHGI